MRTVLLLLLLLLLLNIIIIEASYSSCKSELASYKNLLNKYRKEKNNLIQADKELTTGIYVQDDFIFEIYNNKKKLIGYTEILDTKNHYIHRLVPKNMIPENNVIFYTDIYYLGLYQFYPIGRYIKKDISLNERTISSIIIPDDYIVYLYAYDNFQGIFKKVTSNMTFLEDFNDKTVSFEIVRKNNDTDYYALLYSDSNIQKLVIGEQKLILTQIKSLYILPNYELIIYKNNIIIDVINKHGLTIFYTQIQNIIPSEITLVIHEINSNNITKVILFEDIDYTGTKEVFILNNITNFENELIRTNNTVSSIIIPDGFHIQLFEYNNYTGANIILKNNINNLIKYTFNDRTKSIKIISSNSINPEYVTIYTEKNFNGDSYYLPLGETICDSSFWFHNKCLFQLQIKSIKIPNNYKVIINKSIIITDFTIILTKDSNDITNFLEVYIKSIIVTKSDKI
jgi:hypothetical protein